MLPRVWATLLENKVHTNLRDTQHTRDHSTLVQRFQIHIALVYELISGIRDASCGDTATVHLLGSENDAEWLFAGEWESILHVRDLHMDEYYTVLHKHLFELDGISLSRMRSSWLCCNQCGVDLFNHNVRWIHLLSTSCQVLGNAWWLGKVSWYWFSCASRTNGKCKKRLH